ncbi:MAG: UPF0149 family protein [Acetobacteraceae bacterium]
MSRPRSSRHRRHAEAMRLEELEDWLDCLDPPPLIDGVSMLDGYLTAVIIGPCSIDPHEWLRNMLGPHGRLGAEGTKQAAAIMAIVARFNAISEGLATAPERYAPIFERTDDGTVLAGPWCMGFLTAMKLRYAEWAALRDLSRLEHGLLLPVLLHCTDGAGRSILGPTRPGPEGEAFLRAAYHDIPVVVPAIREFWMPQRARS